MSDTIDQGADRAAASARAALTFGNFVIGCGVLVLPGMLNELAADLGVSIPTAGQLLTLAGIVMCLGAPLGAALTSRVDRRRLLVITMWLYCAGHAACALAPGYVPLAVVRPFAVLGAAVFTPQAAATIALLVPAHRRAAAVTAIFVGWSVASVMGMPIGSLVAGHFHWRAGFAIVAVLAAVSAVWVARVVPAGLSVPPLSRSSWLEVARSDRLRRVLLVTFVSSTGQFTLLSYVSPALAQAISASPAQLALLFAVNGACGVAGNVVLSRHVAPATVDRSVFVALAVMGSGLAIWTVAAAADAGWPVFMLGMIFWGMGSFSSNSAQQARLGLSAPSLASASIALNTSFLYAGQAAGAALGGAVVAMAGFRPLGAFAVALLAAALLLSAHAHRARPHA